MDHYIKKLEDNLRNAKSVIRKVGDRWCVFSKTGKRLGCFPTKKQAEEHLKRIEMFKNIKND